MRILYKFTGKRECSSIFDGSPNGRSKYRERMKLSWKIWKEESMAINQSFFLLVYKNPETQAERNSIKRMIEKIEQKGSLEIIEQDENNNECNIHS